MSRKYIALSAVLMCCAAPLHAQDEVDTIPVEEASTAEEMDVGAVPIAYTYAAARYVYTDYDETGINQDGIGIEGSFLVMPNLYVVGSVFHAETDEFSDPFSGGQTTFKQTLVDLGAGYRYGLTPTVDIIGELRAVRADVEAFGFSDDDTGFQVGAGVRAMVLPMLEVRGGATYLDVFEESETDFILSGVYTIVPQLAAGLDFILGDEEKSVGVTVRYSF